MNIEANVKDAIANARHTNSKHPASDKEDTGINVSGEFHNFIADMEDLIKEATSLTGDELNQAKAKLSHRIDSAKKSVEELGGEIAAQARQGASATNDYVHHQPWQAIGTGAAVGLLVGFMLARRS